MSNNKEITLLGVDDAGNVFVRRPRGSMISKYRSENPHLILLPEELSDVPLESIVFIDGEFKVDESKGKEHRKKIAIQNRMREYPQFPFPEFANWVLSESNVTFTPPLIKWAEKFRDIKEKYPIEE